MKKTLCIFLVGKVAFCVSILYRWMPPTAIVALKQAVGTARHHICYINDVLFELMLGEATMVSILVAQGAIDVL